MSSSVKSEFKSEVESEVHIATPCVNMKQVVQRHCLFSERL